MGAENCANVGIRSPDLLDRSQSLYRKRSSGACMKLIVKCIPFVYIILGDKYAFGQIYINIYIRIMIIFLKVGLAFG